MAVLFQELYRNFFEWMFSNIAVALEKNSQRFRWAATRTLRQPADMTDIMSARSVLMRWA